MRAGRRVVITGWGAVTPLGLGIETLLDRWLDREVGIQDGLGRCPDFDPADLLSKKELRRTERFTQFALVAADQALAQAGWDGGTPVDPERVGCVIGTAFGGIASIEEQHIALRETGKASPLGISLAIHNAPCATAALRWGLRGPSRAVASACATGADSLGEAARMIAAGDADAMLAGGISRPFDARRDGMIMAEGAGMVVLEAAEVAEGRGAEALGELMGYGATTDAHHLTAPDPNGGGAARAIQRALEDAGVLPEELDYVNAHGTSTPLNDRAETMAIKAALGEVAGDVPVSSLKSVVGHLNGAAGTVETAVTVAALRRGVAPPTVGYAEPEEGLDLDYVGDGPRPLRPRGANGRAYGISNSFGWGGHNAVLCVGAPRNGG